MRLIVTRPEPEASRTAEALRALGHEPILSPALDIVLDPQAAIPDLPFQALLVTSGNAVRALAANPAIERLVPLPILAVGDRTALVARRAGFQKARSAGGDAAALVDLALETLEASAGPLLYLAGEHRSAELDALLAPSGFTVFTSVIYHSEERPRLSDAAVVALSHGQAEGILLYSRRSAAAFALALRAERLTPLGPSIACFAISEEAAAPLRGVAEGPFVIAERPDQISLFAALEAHS